MKSKTTLTRLTLCVITVIMVLSMVVASHLQPITDAQTNFKLLDGQIHTNISDYLDSSVVYKLPDGVKDTDKISVIISLMQDSLLDAYGATDTDMSFSEFVNSEEADAIRAEIAKKSEEIISDLDNATFSYKTGASYSTVLSGFEITVLAGDFEEVCELLGDRAKAIVGEVYNVAETQLVENTVNVYSTGIFNSAGYPFDGTGTVVAVLDTGLDYDHTAFSVNNFTADRSKLAMTFEDVLAAVSETRASQLQSGLTAADLYMNEKVPFAFDYADNDADVFPIASDHGTHVAGVIAGKDDMITGVAPNAQLMIMKTFSDTQQTARTSWILSALEDCVVMGVDVINMSLGSACGFSRVSDKEAISGVYDKIREHGISLIVAASNSYSSAFGSEKNGNLGLTSNPDSGTVGSPGTYGAALSVASINGAKTPYLLYNDTIIYFDESSDRFSEPKNFFEEFFAAGQSSMDIEYVTIPGVGRTADYTGIDVTNKIALVRRGDTTFEEKANVAQQQGAAGVIIYNNVSGEIKMNVGATNIPVCSISQDDGEMLAAHATGIIRIDRSQTSGPFMSDFSSWGPTPDLTIKPEITAHGGEILSAVPGQSYDRLSGTSMACPNVAGLAALLRQYVKENFPAITNDPVAVTNFVNRLMMSTADIIFNTNGLPYAVRKQGAGLANLDSSSKTTAFIVTYNKDGSEMDKTKLELGDDPKKTGVYTMTFGVQNFGTSTLTYDVSAYVMTEGVSDTKTSHGDTTVTEEAYALSGASVSVSSISNGTKNGNTVTVAAGQTAVVTVTVQLSKSDKEYLDKSFKNGMYVEGFVVLDAVSGTQIDLSVPYLAFYGDWTQAPLFDLDYYATNKDELDNALDPEDKTMADAYPTRPVGGIEDDYVNYMGSYYFQQNPSATQISASRDYISISNQVGSVHSLRYVWAGMLRNAEKIVITITEDSTGEVIYEKVENDVRKSYGDGGSIRPANIEIEFDAIEQNLKNNTSYTVTLKGYLDYGDGGENTNLNNVFSFPMVTDFEAPALTDVEFYTEYDKSAKKTRLYAKLAVYDNHYSMAAMVGYVSQQNDGTYTMQSFDKYLTPVYSQFNSTSYVVYELTDYIYELKKNAANQNTFTVACYDFALNNATYEIELPDEFTDFYFAEQASGLTLNPNETYTLSPIVYPSTEWSELLRYNSSNTSVARIVNNKIIAVGAGDTVISARDPVTKQLVATFDLHVRGTDEDGYVLYDKPVADVFALDGFLVNKAFYQLNTEDRSLGLSGDNANFNSSSSYSLSMYPSESVTLRYKLDAYFPNETTVTFETSNSDIVTVDQEGTITAVAQGYASIAVRVLLNGKATYYSISINITVKDPFITTGPQLTHYFGNGGVVTFPSNLAITDIAQYAFSNYEYVLKDENDEISEEDPSLSKIMYIGDDTITSVIIPEGIKSIGQFAFANLTALESVTLPSTLERIDYGAFYGCKNLHTVKGLENVKFINQQAFEGCNLKGEISPENAVAIADRAFANNSRLEAVVLSEKTKSVSAYAFANCPKLKKVTIEADKIKLGKYAFQNCTALEKITLNTSVLPAGAFDGCTSLKEVNLGADVTVIGEYAFRKTAVRKITVDAANTAFKVSSGNNCLLDISGTTLVLVTPAYSGDFRLNDANITTIAAGAFSGASKITSVYLPSVQYVGDYAFSDCISLNSVTLGSLKQIGEYAFNHTAISVLPRLDPSLTVIGNYAFAETMLTSVTIADGMTIGTGAFHSCKQLKTVVIGDNVTVGDYAFCTDNLSNIYIDNIHSYIGEDGNRIYYIVYDSPITSLTIGKNANLGEGAFYGAAKLENVTLGENAIIGSRAFYNNTSLKSIDLSKATSIGALAFSGDVLYMFWDSELTTPAISSDNYYLFRYYTSKLENVDLSSLTYLGESAFAGNEELKSVILGSGITAIPDGAFQVCNKLESINLSAVKTIGIRAFSETALKKVDLSSAESIGAMAFAFAADLTEVAFNPNGTKILNNAFQNCSLLAKTVNLGSATYVGPYAFAYTALTEADLTAAEYVGDHAFIKEELTNFTVVLGSALTDIGDNPFAMCVIAPFTSTVTESFNGKDYTTTVDTFKVNENIRIIDGSIYRVVPNGLELICYSGSAKRVTVADGTVRISARAFEGSSIEAVVLPSSLAAIGHKAFYSCNDLVLVTFTGYKAPILEEEYDQSYYYALTNFPTSDNFEYEDIYGNIVELSGLGIVPYFMWNAIGSPSNVYYGATFVDYIGHIENTVVMVKPTNGQNYDSFIFAQYFDTVISGAAAADATTQAAIDAINALPTKLTLAHKDAVLAARAAYDLIASLEQRALVTNYLKLTQAEQQIADLEYLQQPQPEDPDNIDDDNQKPKLNFTTEQIIIAALGVAFLIMMIMTIVFAAKAKKSKKAAERALRQQRQTMHNISANTTSRAFSRNSTELQLMSAVERMLQNQQKGKPASNRRERKLSKKDFK